MQKPLPFADDGAAGVRPLKRQLLKWVGNKQRLACRIVEHFPDRFGRYFEPFLGSGAVLATLAPRAAVGSDVFAPLIEVWQNLRTDPRRLKRWYAERWRDVMRAAERNAGYELVRQRFNARPNGPDLLFLCRACYGGVVRFRKADGHMSTPCGPHVPIPPAAFAARVDEWHIRTKGSEFLVADYRDAMAMARPGDMIYCDPPYRDTQRILYGAQGFNLGELFATIRQCKSRGVFVALSLDGTKRSGDRVCDVPVPRRLFERTILLDCGRSMLKRFQMQGRSLESEVVADRLLLTY